MNVLFLFAAMEDRDVEWLAGNGAVRGYAAGEALIAEGSQPDFGILLSGHAEVVKGRARIARIRPGEILGEINLLDSRGATATVRAEGEAVALFVSRAEIMAKLGADRDFAARLYEGIALTLVDRLRNVYVRFGDAMDKVDLAGQEEAVGEVDPAILKKFNVSSARFGELLRKVH